MLARSARANLPNLRWFFDKVETPYRGWLAGWLAGWLGREESNLRMAESKSDQSSFPINGHSEKNAIFSPNSINRLGRVSERRLKGLGH